MEIARQITEPLLTCDAVLAETAFHLRSSSVAVAFVREGLVRLAFDLNAQLPRVAELAAQYSDRRPDLADLCLIRISELYPDYPVITTDVTDFRVYRRGRRQVIPLLMPARQP